MKSVRALLCGAVLCGVVILHAQAPAPKTHLKVGDTAPDFTLPASTGGNISLSQFRGKNAVVLAFFPAAFSGG
jgi:peroxiredoxin Q/BCP